MTSQSEVIVLFAISMAFVVGLRVLGAPGFVVGGVAAWLALLWLDGILSYQRGEWR